MPSGPSLRISHVGLRGTVGTGMTAAHAMEFASAFGTFTGSGPVLLSRDTRASGVMFREGVVSALLATGHDVVDLGVVSTPVLQHTIASASAAGGLSISASHNSAEWNAVKFFGPKGTYLSTAEAGELLDIYHLHKFAFTGWQAIGRYTTEPVALDRYLDDLANIFDLPSLRSLRVVVDCCNGTSALILQRLKARFDLDLILINASTGFGFAHEPAISRAVVDLQLAPLIRPLRADVGFLFDADSDRVAFATEEGQAVSEELVLPLLADHLLATRPGKLVITNLSTTALLEDIATRHGGSVIRVPVGRQAAMDALSSYRPEQIAIAGEGTGAVMMPQFRFIYDGIASMLAILTIMRERGQRLSAITRAYPRYEIIKGEAPLSPQRIPALFRELQELHCDGTMNTADGLRIDWPNRWFHVRVSQTEPILRIICEQRDDPPRELYQSLMERIQAYA